MLGRWLVEMATAHEGGDNHHAATVDGVEVMVVCDEDHDRMRAMAPIADADALGRDELTLLLEANFDRALDAKYTIWRGAVVALYVHPLASLSRADFESGMRQVAALKRNFGTSFASTNLTFGDSESEPPARSKPARKTGKHKPN